MPQPVARTLQIQTPRVFLPLLQPARYLGIWGGRGGGKSHFVAEYIIERCLLEPGLRVVCVREFQSSLEQSVKRLLEDVIARLNVEKYFRVMHAHIETPGDGIIIFQGMRTSTSDSIKSLEGYDLCWCEEAQSLSDRSLTMLRPTIRKENSSILFSWNPNLPTDPVDVLLRSERTPPNTIVVRANYSDNPWFPDVLQGEMEWDRSRDPEKYAHVWLGEYQRNSEARVFKNWVVEEFETPDDTMFLWGADWGYSVDPAVLIRCWVRGRNLYIDRECYRIGVEVDHLPALFDQIGNGMARNWPIFADSAAPQTISYLQRNGYPKLQPAVKGPNSIKEGVVFLQSYDIKIHPRCTHVIDEFTHYSFKIDPLTGLITPILSDNKNNTIDSCRYAVEKLRAPIIDMSVTW